MVDLLAEIAARKQATPAQIALAWLLAQKPWLTPIPGTTKLNRLTGNVGAGAIEPTAEDLRQIDAVASKITVQGARCPEASQKLPLPAPKLCSGRQGMHARRLRLDCREKAVVNPWDNRCPTEH